MSTHPWQNPVAFFINGIGDSILNLPALRALAAGFSGRLTLVCASSPQAHLFRELPLAKTVPVQKTRTKDGPRFDCDMVLASIDACDLFVSLVPWHCRDMDAVLRGLRPELSVGFHRRFDINLPLDFDKHSAHLAFDAVRAVWPDARFDEFLAPPVFAESVRTAVAEMLAPLAPRTRRLVLHCDTLPEKMWPSDRFRAVLDRFLESHGDYVCLVVGGMLPDIVPPGYEERVISTIGLRLPMAQHIVATSDVFLGVDSCHLHMADFCGVPSVGLFGPTRAHEFGFLRAPNRTLQAAEGMLEITVDHVTAALEDVTRDPTGSITIDCAPTAKVGNNASAERREGVSWPAVS